MNSILNDRFTGVFVSPEIGGGLESMYEKAGRLYEKAGRLCALSDVAFGVADRIEPGWDCAYCGALQPLGRYSCRCCGAPKRRES